jgi:hypothetical protein
LNVEYKGAKGRTSTSLVLKKFTNLRNDKKQQIVSQG